MKKFELKGLEQFLIVQIVSMVLGLFIESIIVDTILVAAMAYTFGLLYKEFGTEYFKKATHFGYITVGLSIVGAVVGIIFPLELLSTVSIIGAILTVVTLLATGIVQLISMSNFLNGLIEVAKLGRDEVRAKKLKGNLSLYIGSNVAILIATASMIAMMSSVVVLGITGIVVLVAGIALFVVIISMLVNMNNLLKGLKGKEYSFNTMDDANTYYTQNPQALSESLEVNLEGNAMNSQMNSQMNSSVNIQNDMYKNENQTSSTRDEVYKQFEEK